MLVGCCFEPNQLLLVGAATSIIFCRDKTRLLSRKKCAYCDKNICRDKITFVATTRVVATKVILVATPASDSQPHRAISRLTDIDVSWLML